ncbi:MAG: SpoVG family protein [bacterium]
MDDEDQRVLAYASVVLDEEFVVHNIRLVETEEKVFVAMPNEEYRDGFRDIAHPISNGCRERIFKAIASAYNEHPETNGVMEKHQSQN